MATREQFLAAKGLVIGGGYPYSYPAGIPAGNLALGAGTLFYESAIDALSAAGSNQATGLLLTNEVNKVTTTGAGTGVVLPASGPGLTIMVINTGANALQVYGLSTDTIDAQTSSVGVSQMQGSVCFYVSTAAGTWQSEGIGTGYAGSFPTLSFTGGITAKIGGGQSSGTPMTTVVNRFTTVTSATDSATLPLAAGGMQLIVANAAAANSMNLFPNTGDVINALAANAAFAIAAGKTATIYSAGPGFWNAVLSA